MRILKFPMKIRRMVKRRKCNNKSKGVRQNELLCWRKAQVNGRTLSVVVLCGGGVEYVRACVVLRSGGGIALRCCYR
jgi:hypothetical protein